MTLPPVFVELTRGGLLESQHRGHAIICTGNAEIIDSWGDPDKVIFPRSSCKMVQALPLVESGAADAMGLSSAHLALACASHQGAPVHVDAVADWLAALDIPQSALICGPQMPRDADLRRALIKTDQSPCPIHNNCSGKHAGFLSLAQHLGADGAYTDLDHPVQIAVRAATEETADEEAKGIGIDGCSAPNFALTLRGLARQMACFVRAPSEAGLRPRAMTRLVNAMRSHPELVAGEGRACTDLMRAAGGEAAIKTGAEGVFVAILPELDRAIVLKIEDGGTRASNCAIAALLVRVGAVSASDPQVARHLSPAIQNWDGLVVGQMQAAQTLR